MGALTNKLYAYKARPWERTNYQSISLTDPFLSSVIMEMRGRQFLRILPVVGKKEWISNDARFPIVTKKSTKTSSVLKLTANHRYDIENIKVVTRRTNSTGISLLETLVCVRKLCKNNPTVFVSDGKAGRKLLNSLKKMPQTFSNSRYAHVTTRNPVNNLLVNELTSPKIILEKNKTIKKIYKYSRLHIYGDLQENNEIGQNNLLSLYEGRYIMDNPVTILSSGALFLPFAPQITTVKLDDPNCAFTVNPPLSKPLRKAHPNLILISTSPKIISDVPVINLTPNAVSPKTILEINTLPLTMSPDIFVDVYGHTKKTYNPANRSLSAKEFIYALSTFRNKC